MLCSICLAFSGFSTNTKYDPYQIKAEIASRRDRVSNLFFHFVKIQIRHGEGRGTMFCFVSFCLFVLFTLVFT